MNSAESDLKAMPERLMYFWLHDIRGDKALVSKWNEAPHWIDIYGVALRPDLELGTTVVRKIPSGKMVQYFSFEMFPTVPFGQ